MWREMLNTLLRAVVSAAVLPHQAASSLDAILRVWYRRLISHRHLLEWETAQETHKNFRNRRRQFLTRIAWIPAAAAITGLVLLRFAPRAAVAALPFLLLWIFSPLIVSWLNASVRKEPDKAVTDSDRQMLRQTARLTWRYFADFVNPDTNWLPPDNYQESLRVEVAQRTSPTNIGLGMLAVLAAHDFGYVTADEVLDRTASTLETLDKLERYEGHLLNWYEIRTLQPLLPRYVSMVDSGNLLGDLWTLEHGLEELISGPLLSDKVLDGLQDAIEILQSPSGAADREPSALDQPLSTLNHLVSSHPQGLEGLVRRIHAAADPACAVAAAAQLPTAETSEKVRYWSAQIKKQVCAFNTMVDLYLSWVELIASPPEDGLLELGQDAHEWRRLALASVPSLQMLASGDVPGLRDFLAAQRRGEALKVPASIHTWLDAIEKAATRSQQAAGDQLARADDIFQRIRSLADGMNMKFLYDGGRRLFFTGYNVTEHRMDPGHYDLLASEARLGSFVAIARGDVPTEHWWALGRPYGTAFGLRELLSWGGTMFEYLMPTLLMRNYPNSLLDEACRAAVACQMAYGRQRDIPWGISESASSALDARQTYQYRAFGVPGLGMKRGLEQDLVVAPYATALALAVDPVAAIANLRRLAGLSRSCMRGNYGYYESLDYTRQLDQRGDRGVIVYAYMAHHQGMILAAIDNALHDNVLQKRFHHDARVRATESLLYERIPASPAIARDNMREEHMPRLAPLADVPISGRIETPNTSTPKTNLLSNGTYSIMVTSAGSGYSRWRDIEVTRWRADTTCDAYGSYCYIKDADSSALWSAGYQPVKTAAGIYSVIFTADKAEFKRRDSGIETRTEIAVSPEDNVEVRRITLTNHSDRKRRIELTSYAEIALAQHNTDRAHPAFNKIFIETEAAIDLGALLAHRRPRSAEDPEIWAVHLAAVDSCFDARLEYETDRAAFIGRGRTIEKPLALEDGLTHSIGLVLDPVFSIRRYVTLSPGQRAEIAFITGAAASRQEAVALAEKYHDLHASHRALEMAWTHAQLELRHLGVQQDDSQQFQELASHTLYPNAQLRPSSERLSRNTLPQSRLWAYGISGDLPIVLVRIAQEEDISLVRQALIARDYWQVRGHSVDLVVLNEEISRYDAPVQSQVRRLIDARAVPATPYRQGGAFLLQAGQIPEEERNLLMTSARVVLVASRGPLAQQLITPAIVTALPPLLPKNTRIPEEPSAPLPFMELAYFNGLGGFTHDGKEYAIYLGPDSRTPLPWINVIANPTFGTLISETGAGFSWYGNSQSNRLTPWSNDPVSDPAGDALYIRDEEMGVFWTPTPSAIRERDAYRARHGQGYSVFEHNSHAIEQELTTYVPMDAKGGAPIRIQRLRLTNRSSRRRRLTVTFYCDWVLGTDREDTQLHVRTQWNADSQLLLARNPNHPDFGSRVAFIGASLPVTSYSGDRTFFLGRNGVRSAPAALLRTRLSGRVGAGLDPCGAIQVTLEIEPQGQAEVSFFLGQASDAEQAHSLAEWYRNPEAVEAGLQTTRNWWDEMLQTVQVEAPELSVDFLLNRWLLYQDLSCRLWGRSAFYQSGGAFGFRDQLQDVMALVYAAPDLARAQILRTAARQFEEGDVQHWWHPASGAGVRTRISDDLLWLPFVTAQYVRVTGDAGILDENIPYLHGKLLDEHEAEAYYVPEISEDHSTLLEHCRRAVTKGLTSGPHGLPLIGSGDWNDGLNRVGIGGKGESVWLAWFLIHVMNDLAEMQDLRPESHDDHPNETKTSPAEWREKAKQLAATIEEQAWDGAWYRRAYFDDGTPLGSAESEEARIDSLAQSWSVISDAGDAVRSKTAMESVEEHLVCKEDRMVLLFTPPFDKSPHDPGYIKGYPPGVRENGGQYTHGSLWVPMAFARQGEGDKAVTILRLMNPIEHAREPEDVQRYKVEPYVAAADIYALEGRVGRGGWTWYTGSAGWMYRVWLEEVLGFKLRGNTLEIAPCIASGWPGFTIRYQYRSAHYEITVENPDHVCRGVVQVEVDGDTAGDGKIALVDDGGRHTVRVVMGSGQTALPTLVGARSGSS
jgi:cellobiose phosphorylase